MEERSSRRSRRRGEAEELLHRRSSCPRHGEALHAWALKSSTASHAPVANSLISFYSSLPRPLLPAARRNPSQRPRRRLLDALSRHRSLDALSRFRSMLSSSTVLPSPHSLAAAFAAAACAASAPAGTAAHALACKIPSVVSNVYECTSLLNMYCKLGIVSDARRVFDEMPQRNSFREAGPLFDGEAWIWEYVKNAPDRDVIAWNSIISGFSQNGCGNGALDLFEEMKMEYILTEDGKLGYWVVKDGLLGFVPVENSLVTMYAKAGMSPIKNFCWRRLGGEPWRLARRLAFPALGVAAATHALTQGEEKRLRGK
uniref:Pentatricopeptide repeat-containing protein n=1 Tax=Oryza punctata TaxID=4537 RepID=A0A0E0L015_ORYPU